jgi:hypothetical protein
MIFSARPGVCYAADMPGLDFEDLVDQYERYLARVEPASVREARSRLTAWMRDGVPNLQVRVVLTGNQFPGRMQTG